MESLSSREVMVLDDGHLYFFLRVPVPEGYRVTSCGAEGNPNPREAVVKYLPPIRVRYIPAEAHASKPVVRLSCPWLNFSQVRKVGAMVDAAWDPTITVADNILQLCHSLPKKVLRDLALTEGVSLLWKSTVNARVGPQSDKPRRPRRLSKHVVVETETQTGKRCPINELLVEHCEDEANLGIREGTEEVSCILKYVCADRETILPTMAVRLVGCDEPHYLCTGCSIVLLREAVIAPKCPVQGCHGELRHLPLVLHLTRHDPVLLDKCAAMLHHNEVKRCAPELSPCQGCGKGIRPRDFVQVCPYCDHCWCHICVSTVEGDWRVCPYKVGLEFFQEQSPEKAIEMSARYGEELFQKGVAEFNRVTFLLHTTHPCPGCDQLITKSEGCNKMTCEHCLTVFCHLCGDELDRWEPYRHFDAETHPVFDLE